MACSIPKRVRVYRDNNNGSGSDSASDYGSDDDVVNDMKMKQLEQKNQTNIGNNNNNNNNNIDNNNNNNLRIFANKTDNTFLPLIVQFSQPRD